MPRAKVSKKVQEAETSDVNGVENLKKSRAKKIPIVAEPAIEVNGKPKGRASKKAKTPNIVEAEVEVDLKSEEIQEEVKIPSKEKPTKRKLKRDEVTNGAQENGIIEEPKTKAGRGGKKGKVDVVEKKTENVEVIQEVAPQKPKSGRRVKKADAELKTDDVPAAPIASPKNKPAAIGKGRKKKETVAPQTDVVDTISADPKPTKANKAEKANDKPKIATKRGRTKVQEETPSHQQIQEEIPIEESPKKKAKVETTETVLEAKVDTAETVLRAKKSRSKKTDEQNEIDEVVAEPKKTGSKKTKDDTPKSTVAAPKSLTGRKRAATKLQPVTAEDTEEDVEDDVKPKKAKKPPMNDTKTTYNKSDFDISTSIVIDGNTSSSSSNGLEHQKSILKISSWNVAGLRSWLKKGGLEFLDYEEPDIFCLQETKCTTEQLPEEAARIPGYHPYWLCMPGGYAGVALYSKIMPINVEYGIGNEEFDAAGRLITAEYEKFYLINVYVPNSGRKLVNLEARMRWEKLFQGHVKKFDARKPVIVCGDMNVSHQEIDLANPKSNARSAGFTIEEREKMTELLALGYVDTFRHLYPEKRGAYTYWTYMANARSRNVGWRLDYFIVSERILKRVVENAIRAQCMGSDHCPITLFLNI